MVTYSPEVPADDLIPSYGIRFQLVKEIAKLIRPTSPRVGDSSNLTLLGSSTFLTHDKVNIILVGQEAIAFAVQLKKFQQFTS